MAETVAGGILHWESSSSLVFFLDGLLDTVKPCESNVLPKSSVDSLARPSGRFLLRSATLVLQLLVLEFCPAFHRLIQRLLGFGEFLQHRAGFFVYL